ncbi:MAG: rod shape-determining protein RodA [Clostridia bacterium]|nr:rod shape-determining protein RodA [Clostridia bacterium]
MFKNLLKNTDYIALAAMLLLFVIGVVAIFSAGYMTDLNKDEYIKQIVWFGLAFVLMVIVWAFDYSIFGVVGYIIYGINLILLVAVLFMPSLMGASSWFNLGGVLYQPSELMKIGYILSMAKMISKFLDINPIEKKKRIMFCIGMGALLIVPVVLILLQPDFGTAVVFLSISAFMIFKMGIKYRYILVVFVIAIALLPVIYFFVLNPTQQERIKVFIDPSLDPLGSGYNAIQSKIAVGSGMLLGTGFLKGTQTQYGYLPIKSSDFIFSVISEEFGFVGSVAVIVLFTVLLLRIIRVSRNARDHFASYAVMGIAGMFAFHFIENIGMTIGLLPITGVPLPFVSYGGSNLITNCLAMGIVLNVSARKSNNMFLD